MQRLFSKRLLFLMISLLILLVSTSYAGWRLANETMLFFEGILCLTIIVSSFSLFFILYDKILFAKQHRESPQSFLLESRMSVEERNLILTAISHDMKTPLTRAILKLNLLKESSEIQSIINDLQEMNTIIKTTLDFSQSPNNIRKVPIELISLLEMMIEQESDHPDFHISLDTSLISVEMYAEIHLFKRMIQNIIDNARKYASHCSIKVRDLDHNYVIITFADNGPGVPENLIKRLTEVYFRVDPSRSKDTGGIGLGLAIVKKITDMHHGQIKCRNNKEGFQVQLIFPIITAE